MLAKAQRDRAGNVHAKLKLDLCLPMRFSFFMTNGGKNARKEALFQAWGDQQLTQREGKDVEFVEQAERLLVVSHV